MRTGLGSGSKARANGGLGRTVPTSHQSAMRITRNREDAEDALQDVFLSAFIHIKNFDGRSSFSTCFTRIAINSVLMTLRKKRSSREIPIGFGESDANGVGWDVPGPSANPEQLCAQREKEGILGKQSASYGRRFAGLLRFNSARDFEEGNSCDD